jgi:hypothetical protein
VVARNGAKRDVELGMTRSGERQIVLQVGAVEADVSRVDDESRPQAGDDSNHRSKVGDKPRPPSAQVSVGDLDDTEAVHIGHDSDEP